MYIIEGNIGAGKSTFLNVINKYLPQITTVHEPLASWDSQKHGASLLQKFMEDAPRWSYTMETFAMICRVQAHMKDHARPEPFVVVERSIYSGHYVFSVNGYKQGFMTEKEWHMYSQYFNYLIPGYCRPPHGFIYLRTSPEIAYERIRRRQRAAEDSITLEYLQQVHDRHEEFLVQKKGVVKEIYEAPVLVLDCDIEFEGNPKRCKELSRQVEQFMMHRAGSYGFPGTPAKECCD